MNADVRPPQLLAAVARASIASPALSSVVLSFDETLAASGAQAPGNYTINQAGGGTVTVNTAVLNGTNVTLNLVTPLTWGVTYTVVISSAVTDTAQTPNSVSPNTATILEQIVALDYTADWKYDETKTDTDNYDAVAWYATSGFDDTSWATGPGILAEETSAGVIAIAPAPFNTTLTETTHTIYFRTTFDWTLGALPANGQFTVNHFIDDGVRCFLNGSEAFRYKMPTGDITFTNEASAGGEAIVDTTNLVASSVLANNTIACDLHTSGTASSDAVFGLEIVAEYPVGVTAPELTIDGSVAGQITISWNPDDGVLYEADSPIGPWTVVSGATNPMTLTTTQPMKFYSLRQ